MLQLFAFSVVILYGILCTFVALLRPQVILAYRGRGFYDVNGTILHSLRYYRRTPVVMFVMILGFVTISFIVEENINCASSLVYYSVTLLLTKCSLIDLTYLTVIRSPFLLHFVRIVISFLSFFFLFSIIVWRGYRYFFF